MEVEDYENDWGVNINNPHKVSCNANNVIQLGNQVLGIKNDWDIKKVVSVYDTYISDIIDKVRIETELEVKVRWYRIMQMVYYCKHTSINVHYVEEAMNMSMDYKHVGNESLFRFMPVDVSENNRYQNFLLYAWEYFQQNNYKKLNGDVYQEIITKDGYNSHAWKKVGSIQEVLYASVNKETNYNQFLNITSGRDVVKPASEFLSSFQDSQLPLLEKDRKIFSFKNGVYFAEDDIFTKYLELENSKFVSSKYFDLEFPEDRLYNTPYLDSIVEYQKLPKDVIEWIYAMIGRLIYLIDEKDGWQVIMFIEGQAGTGKSTIISVCKELYECDDVGVMSNNIQKQFGLSDLINKMIYIAPEIKHDFSIDQAEFQSIVSGDKINIAVKHKDSISMVWDTPGVMAGNETPDFIDNSGSIQRRIFPIKFNFKVAEHDLQLMKKLKSEMAHIIPKCNKIYRDKADQYGRKNIWTLIPDYFRETQNEIAASTNPFFNFMISNKLQYSKDKYIPENILKAMYNLHCTENNYKKQRWNKELYLGPIQQLKIKIDKCTKTYNGRKITDVFFIGIDASQEELFIEEEE